MNFNKRGDYYKQDIYKIKNKEKYIGTKEPYYRSSYEQRMMTFLDLSENVKKWSCDTETHECLSIEYYLPTDKKMHRYFPDFYVEIIDKEGKLKKYIVEIKPKIELTPPPKPKINNQKAMRRYYNLVNNYIKNTVKWETASRFCQHRGMEFKLITENDLF